MDGNKIIEFNLKDYLKTYIDTCKENLTKSILKRNEDIQKRLKKLNTLLFVSENIELIVDIIKNSKDIQAARDCLMHGKISNIDFSLVKYKNAAKKLRLDEEEADIILQTKLSQLVNTDVIKVKKEKGILEKELKTNTDILNSENKFNVYLINKLKSIKNKFGKDRKTKIKNSFHVEEIREVEAEPEEIYALINTLGYIKFINKASYSMASDLSEYVIISMMSNDRLGLFYEDGYLRYIDPSIVGITNISSKGDAIEYLTQADNLKYLLAIPQTTIESSKILFVSQEGYGKIIDGKEYVPTGKALYKKVLASKLNKDDVYLTIEVFKDQEFIEVESQDRILKFKINEVSEYGKQARGMIVLNKKYLPLISVSTSNFKSDKVGKRASVGTRKEKNNN